VRSAKVRPVFRLFFWLFIAVCLVLGWAGGQPAEGPALLIGRIATILYFAHFLVFLPLLGWFERPTALPSSIAEPIFGGGKIAGAAAMEKA
jgi:ubiquinol-cytochrome c reductase cytochrome b subunit